MKGKTNMDKMRKLLSAVLATIGFVSVAADAAYSEKPATEPIEVTDGTSTFMCASSPLTTETTR